MTDLGGNWWQFDLPALAAALRSGELSACVTVEACLARIEAVNPRVRAVTSMLAEGALAAADAADAAQRRGAALGPLHGVPFTVKENVDVAGLPTTSGARVDAPPAERDAPEVVLLRRAGAIPIARTNLPDFALRMHTDSRLYGATRNPWDAARTPGGSSGGEAVAVATGMSPLGVGNDLGGSLRLPGAWCGVVAIRPSNGRVPHASSAGTPAMGGQLFGVGGPIARTVDGVRLALDTMTGVDARDPRATGAPGVLEGAPRRVAVVADPGGRDVDPAVADGIARAADALRDAGYAVEEAEPPRVEEAARLWALVVYAELRPNLDRLRAMASPDAMRYADLTLALDPPATLEDYIAAFQARMRLQREWGAFLARYPVILGPVSTMLPFAVGYDIAGAEEAAAVRRSLRLTLAATFLGLPAVAVPAGTTTVDGRTLPIGVQVIARAGADARALDAAGAIEARLGVVTPLDPR